MIREKTDWQKSAERNKGIHRVKKVQITAENDRHDFKIGQIVEVDSYGTFGMWTKNNEWVDFYSCKEIK